MGTKIVRRKTQPDNQPPVTEDLLLITKDRVCKLRMKARERLGLFLVRLNYREMDSVIGVTGPYRGGIPISSFIIKQKKGYFNIQSSSLDILLSDARRQR